jgi:hypothetical protein
MGWSPLLKLGALPSNAVSLLSGLWMFVVVVPTERKPCYVRMIFFSPSASLSRR